MSIIPGTTLWHPSGPTPERPSASPKRVEPRADGAHRVDLSIELLRARLGRAIDQVQTSVVMVKPRHRHAEIGSSPRDWRPCRRAIAHGGVALRLSATKAIDPFRRRHRHVLSIRENQQPPGGADPAEQQQPVLAGNPVRHVDRDLSKNASTGARSLAIARIALPKSSFASATLACASRGRWPMPAPSPPCTSRPCRGRRHGAVHPPSLRSSGCWRARRTPASRFWPSSLSRNRAAPRRASP